MENTATLNTGAGADWTKWEQKPFTWQRPDRSSNSRTLRYVVLVLWKSSSVACFVNESVPCLINSQDFLASLVCCSERSSVPTEVVHTSEHRLQMLQKTFLVVRPQLSSSNNNFSKLGTRTGNLDFWSRITYQLLERLKSTIPNLQIYLPKNAMELGIDNLCRIVFFLLSLPMNKCLERVNDRHFWNPGVFNYAMIPRCRPNSRGFFHCHIYSLCPWELETSVLPSSTKTCVFTLAVHVGWARNNLCVVFWAKQQRWSLVQNVLSFFFSCSFWHSKVWFFRPKMWTELCSDSADSHHVHIVWLIMLK